VRDVSSRIKELAPVETACGLARRAADSEAVRGRAKHEMKILLDGWAKCFACGTCVDMELIAFIAQQRGWSVERALFGVAGTCRQLPCWTGTSVNRGGKAQSA
jgi:hypothetical protein